MPVARSSDDTSDRSRGGGARQYAACPPAAWSAAQASGSATSTLSRAPPGPASQRKTASLAVSAKTSRRSRP